MKTIKIFLVAIMAITIGSATFAQGKTTKKETFKVSGECEMCKSRIEEAAKVNGVTKAVWNEKSKMLTLVYAPSKVKSDDVLKKIAAAGHDTPNYKATDKAYNALPGCCKYR